MQQVAPREAGVAALPGRAMSVRGRAEVYPHRPGCRGHSPARLAQAQRKIEVLPKAFGLIQVGTTADREGSMAWSPVGVVGDSIYLNFTAVGFARDGKTKQPNVKVEMRVLDDKGQAAKGAKMIGTANADVAETMQAIPMQFGITLNREGRFTLELNATDLLTGKTAKVLFPVKVSNP